MKKEYIYLALAALAVWYFLWYKKDDSAASTAANGNADEQSDNSSNLADAIDVATNVINIGSRSNMDADQMQVFNMPASVTKLG